MTKVLSGASKTTCFTELLAVDDHDPEERENYGVGKHLLTMATYDFAVINCIPGVEDFDPLSGEVCRYYLRLVSHCDRIICLYARYPSPCECIWLLNLALKESRVVLCDRLIGGFKVGAVGFGYDSKANDHKVIIIKSPFSIYYGSRAAAELYTLSTNSRKEIELGVEISLFSSLEYQTLYCNGICYWYYWNCRCTKIVAFDVGDEVFHSIRPPPDNVKRSIKKQKNLVDWSKNVVWNNSIALFFYGQGGPAVIDMWIMESDSRGAERSYTWTKYLTMGPLVSIKRPLAFLNDDLLFLETDDSEITSYNIRIFILSDHTIPCQDLRSSHFIVFARS